MAAHQLCSICYHPVGMRPESADKRVPNADGGWDHKSCAEPDPRFAALNAEFGPPVVQMGRVAADRAGKAVGHVTRIERHPDWRPTRSAPHQRWVCSCGATSPWGGSQAELKEDAREHKRNAYVWG
jgi:hypothetical protein